jgi:recombination protein RecT
MAQSLVKSNEGQPKFSLFMSQQNVKNLLANAVGQDAQRFASAIISAVSTNPALQECENSTILSASLLGESLRLSPSPQLGHYYLVPFNDTKNGRKVATFQLGYKGYIQLAMRSGQYLDIDVIDIKQGEYKGRDKRTGKQVFEFVEDDDIRDALPTVGYLAYFELLNGFRKQIYWTKQQMMRHADRYSAAFSAEASTVKTRYGEKTKVSYADYEAGNYDPKDEWMYSSFWYKSFDGMAYKTMLRQLISKWGVMSIEMQEAYTKDTAVINEDGTADYVDTPDTEAPRTDIVVAPEEPKAEEVPPQVAEEFDFFAEQK